MALKKLPFKKASQGRKEESGFQLVFKFSPIPMWIHDRQTLTLLEVNEAAKIQLGYGHADLKKMTLGDVFPADELPPLLANLKRVRRFRHHPGEWHLSPKSGQLMNVVITSQPLEYKGRKALLMTAREGSRQYRAGDDLRPSLMQVHERIGYQANLIENVSDAITALDDQYVLTFWNRAAENIFGWRPEEVIGKKGQDIFRSESIGIDRAEVFRQIQETGWYHGEMIQYRKDGARLYIEVSTYALRDENGKITDYVTVSRDITVHKQMEHELKASIELFRAVAQVAPVGIFRTDIQGKCVYVNEYWQKIAGLTMEEAMGDGWGNSLHPEDKDRIIDEWNWATQHDIPFTAEYRMQRRDGTITWVLGRAIAEKDENGEIGGFVGTITDITELKQTENELLRAQESMDATHKVLQEAFEREQLASRTDALTGVFNRRHFFEFIEYEFALSKRYQHPLSLIIFDLDHLKQVNDAAGHQAGDDVLKQVANIVRSQLRDVDVLARYGGDEFVILLPNSNSKDAYVAAERMRQKIIDTRMTFDDLGSIVTISAGIADLHPFINSSAQLIRHADKALYAAKEAGRNRVVIYSEGGKRNP